LITFLILMIILNKILYKPILAIIQKREGIYEDLKQKAQESKSQLDKGEEEEKSARVESLAEGAKLQGALKGDGQTAERDILSKAQNEASEKLEAARAGLRGDIDSAREELKGEAQNLAKDMASKILKRQLN
jgi:F-type H+-transporting ATPase subunit b